MNRTFIIGEMGSCHDGSLQKALRLVDAAALAGADAVKAQYWSSAKELACRRRALNYLPIYERYAVPVPWLPRLRARAEARGLEFMCTSYLVQDIPVVAPFVSRFKISSFEARDHHFFDAHRSFGKPLIVSLGMVDYCIAGWFGSRGDDVSLLQCTSAYPCPVEDLNMRTIRACGLDGLSDHSGLIETGGLAVAAGARILEVHLKLGDTDPENPDAGDHALLPDALGDYIALVRQVELMLGDGQKRAMPSEAAMLRYQVRA